ncbi:DNA polymerase III subunit gamma/tau [Alicyclobacillus fastidiosus]|uniref:DNA-directed DNA polymerase n=1 Tax=Alicyclobacillus fastidiosus TaxID=392011 RepID=A0ABY6ZH43_9BACL|nr:DNA polymerase III subunit gamma/tau [Alicyclobacillus fastidiosus]WAH42174.1 DNA polymerase III subunit gamma/tau [Alicyclobacillus fastidiosus]GMA63966.1 DNA polymerase III subunit gamma/tau [Alicyclobacillus fastidiosus]
MSYQALYRIWRPQSFSNLMGQPHVRQTLSNAITSGKIAHAYLFCGPRGTGKTSAAKLFAKAVNCEHPDGAEPCNACSACVSITNGSNVDVEEIDAASNRGVDEIRELRDKVHYAPTTVKRKVYIVDEVHMLTTEAFNALLKTLEEPPAHVLFVLATTEAHKIPGTIVSRCQRFDFHRISTETIVERLQEVVQHQGWACDASALWKLAEAADGGLRDALGLLEQAAAFGQGTIDEAQVASVIGGVDTKALLELVGELLDASYLAALDRISSWYAGGKDASRIAFDLLQVLRDLFIVMLSPSDDALHGKPVAPYRVITQRASCSADWLINGISKLGELYTQLRYVEQPRLALEASLLSIATAPKANATVPSHTGGSPTQVPPAAAAGTSAGQPTQQAASQPAEPAAGAPSVPEAGEATDEAIARRRRARAADKHAAAGRKRETLERLYADRNPALEHTVRERWGDVLHKVKQDRIQSHAWLMHGEVAMATDFAVVLSFGSRIHREAVMKPADRQVIESAISVMVDREMQIFALLKEDWDEFIASLQDEGDTGERAPEQDLVERARALFGPDKVIVETKE